MTAVRANREVIKFLTDCGNKNLQHLLVPSRLESALAQMDTDHDGTIDADEWCVFRSLNLWGAFDAAMRAAVMAYCGDGVLE